MTVPPKMMDRRTLIASMAGASCVAPAWAGAAAPSIGAVLYDRRYAASRRFAQAFADRGAAVFAVQDDVIRLWRGPLKALSGSSALRVAGLTTWSDLNLVRDCARERGFRLGGQGMHDPRDLREASAMANADALGVLHSWLIA